LEKNLTLENRPLPQNIHLIEWAGDDQSNPWWKYLWLKNEFFKVVDSIQPDLVHAGPIQKVAFIAALANFHPLISMSWGTDLLMDADQNSWWRWITWYTLRHSDWLIGDCHAVQKKATDFGFPIIQTSVFPWGIDLKRFHPDPDETSKRQFGWENNFVILCTRNWEVRYGVDLVVRAFCKVAIRMPDARLILVGGGSQEKLLRKLVLKTGLQSQVIFAGRIDYEGLPRYYQSADLYISASHSDGSSVSLMEALGCGCPVLVSDIISNLEWVTPGEQGWLFKDGDRQSLSENLVLAYEQRQNLANIKVQSRRTALEKANWNKNFSVLLSTYDDVTGKVAKNN
jgi:glycosyltransferase involved in cell wall biosynthesis